MDNPHDIRNNIATTAAMIIFTQPLIFEKINARFNSSLFANIAAEPPMNPAKIIVAILAFAVPSLKLNGRITIGKINPTMINASISDKNDDHTNSFSLSIFKPIKPERAARIIEIEINISVKIYFDETILLLFAGIIKE